MERPRESIIPAVILSASIRAASRKPVVILPALRLAIFASSIAALPILAFVIVPFAIKASCMYAPGGTVSPLIVVGVVRTIKGKFCGVVVQLAPS